MVALGQHRRHLARSHLLGGVGIRFIRRVGHIRFRRSVSIALALLSLNGIAINVVVAQLPEHSPTLADLQEQRRAIQRALEGGSKDYQPSFDLVAELEELVEQTNGRHDLDLIRLRSLLFVVIYDLASNHDGTMEERLAVIDDALKVAETAGAPNLVPQGLYAKGKILHDFGQFNDAIHVFTEAVEREPESPARPYCDIMLSGLHRSLGHYAQADTHLRSAERLFAGMSDAMLVERNVMSCHIQLDLDLGLPDRAAPWVMRESRVVDDLRDSGPVWFAAITASHIRQANLEYAWGHYGRVLKKIDSFLDDSVLYTAKASERAHLQLMRAMVHADLARIDSDHRTVVQTQLDAVDAAELSPQLRLHFGLIRSEHALRSGDRATAIRTFDAATRAGQAVIESNKRDTAHVARIRSKLAIASADTDEMTHALSELIRAYDALLSEWHDLPIRSGGIGFLRKSSRRDVLAELVRLRIALDPVDGPEQAVGDLLRAQANGSAARLLDLEAPTTDSLRRALLGEGRGVLLCLTAPDRSHVFAIDEKEVYYEELPAEDLLQCTVERYTAILNTPPTPGMACSLVAKAANLESALARELFTELFPGRVGEALTHWSGVTISTLDWLEKLPLACLIMPSGERMGHRIALDHLSSLPLAPWLAARADSRRHTPFQTELLLVAGAEPTEDATDRWPDLRTLKIDMRQMRRTIYQYSADRRTLLFGDRATKRRLLDHPLRETRVLQFLVHGTRDAARERGATLILSGDTRHDEEDNGLLRVEDIEGRGSPQFVMLTACGSGIAPLRLGDSGSASMSLAWLLGGSQAVLQAQSAIALEPTVIMSGVIHEKLAEGSTPAEALSAARRHLATIPRFNHPFYYGLLRIEGLGHLPIFP